MEKYTLTEDLANRVISLADNFDDGDEDCYEAAAELIDIIAKHIKSQKLIDITAKYINSQK